jgi:hypothetical protein
MAKQTAVPVTMRALVQRINRKLAKEGEKLKASRGGRDVAAVGDYYLVDLEANAVCGTFVDPEVLGRKIGVLAQWEHVAEDD